MSISIKGNSSGSVKFLNVGGSGSVKTRASSSGGANQEWETAYSVDFSALPDQDFVPIGTNSYVTIDSKQWYMWSTDYDLPSYGLGLVPGMGLRVKVQDRYEQYSGFSIPWSSLVPGLDLSAKQVRITLRFKNEYVSGATGGDYKGIGGELAYEAMNTSTYALSHPTKTSFVQARVDAYGTYANKLAGYGGMGGTIGDYEGAEVVGANTSTLETVFVMDLDHRGGNLVGDYYSAPWVGSMPEISAMTKVKSINKALNLSSSEYFSITSNGYFGAWFPSAVSLKIECK